jgi:hypothetical protein
VFEFAMDYDGSLADAKDQADSVVAAMGVATKSTGVDVDGVEVVMTAARRRLLATFKVTVTFTGSSGDVQTLAVFFASATNQAALVAALLVEGLDASMLVILTAPSSSDDSWIGIPIGCSLARAPLFRRLYRDALADALHLRTSAAQRACATCNAETLTSTSNPNTEHPNQSGSSVSAVPLRGLSHLRAQEQGCVGCGVGGGARHAAAARARTRSRDHAPGRRHRRNDISMSDKYDRQLTCRLQTAAPRSPSLP